jgi:prepilin-type N-terminal cleavage/methylation domain-containing protein
MKKGFTLIELLIVVGILAILATLTVLILNPAQLFAQARDTQRISDLGALKSAIALYLATVADPPMSPQTSGNTCGTNYWGTVSGATEYFTGSPIQSTQVGRAVDGTGWIPINFNNIPDGSPLSVLPIDPVRPNTAARSYTYQCDNTAKRFEINANMESVRYSNGGANDVESTDGGDNTDVYEVGNDPGLDL